MEHCSFDRCNAHESIFPVDGLCPFGPAAFTGEIVLTERAFPKDNSPEEIDAFAFVVAHELVHVFDAMRFVVPAIMDWKQCWNKMLQGGCRCEAARHALNDKTVFLDD